jgi:hypothetical protein
VEHAELVHEDVCELEQVKPGFDRLGAVDHDDGQRAVRQQAYCCAWRLLSDELGGGVEIRGLVDEAASVAHQPARALHDVVCIKCLQLLSAGIANDSAAWSAGAVNERKVHSPGPWQLDGLAVGHDISNAVVAVAHRHVEECAVGSKCAIVLCGCDCGMHKFLAPVRERKLDCSTAGMRDCNIPRERPSR